MDIEIAFTGMRPGEKLFEELSVDARPCEWDQVVKGVDRLLGLAGQPAAAVRNGLRELVPEYRPSAEG